ncbi:MAG TPA: YihY/virulence factor BrkB family protein [Bryobacteraceae bacterium]|nr:YihY/virulence factor BrkB family protein [Bryobacteraceae bacterium]
MRQARPFTVRAVWDLIKQTASNWNEINAPRLGAALAFYTMLSVSPLLVLLVALAGLVFGPQAAEGRVVGQLQSVIGYEGSLVLQDLLAHTRQLSSGLTAVGAGVLLLIFGASSVFAELRDSLNLVWGFKTKTGSGIMGIIRNRFVAFAMVMGIGFLLVVSLLLSTAIAAAGKFFGSRLPMPATLLQANNAVLTFLAVTVFFALLYKVIPEVRIEWRDVWIGAAVTSALFSLGKLLIGLYIGKAGVGSAYGAAGSLVAFLIWMYYSAQIFFFGAVFTHQFSEKHGSRARMRSLRHPPVEPMPPPAPAKVA